MAKLTARTCETVKPEGTGKDRVIGDGDGLSLRVRSNGTKTWLIEYVFQACRRKYTIGAYDGTGASGESLSAWLKHGRLSLGQARAIAAQWRIDRLAGRDPVAEWETHLAEQKAQEERGRQAEIAEAQQPLVRDIIDLFMTKQIHGKKSAPSIQYRLERLEQLLGNRKIRDLQRRDVIDVLERIAEGRSKGRTAKQLAGEVLVLAKRVWRFAEARGWIETSCIERLSRNDFDARPKKRDVVLGLDEVAELWRALGDPARCTADPTTIAALRLLILTGQREREVTDATWDEFDFASGVWKIPAVRTKSGRAHVVHLAPQALAILQEVHTATGDEGLVFRSPKREGQAIYGRSVNNALLLMFKRGALPRVTPCHVHDLRRTLITRLPDLGFEPFVGHKIANHVLPGVLANYNHNEYLERRREALIAWAERVESLANNANVVQLQRSAV
jgi:integrase